MRDLHDSWNRRLAPLVWGFGASFLFLLASYWSASHLNTPLLPFVLFGAALLQTVIQLTCFLHLGIESKSHWNLIAFLFMLLVIVIVVGGSLWIMYSLDYQMMPH